MARLSWMAKKFTRGMTYQLKAKDMTNSLEYLHGVANILIYHYNKRLLKCRGSRGIGVPEQKRDIIKTRKMLRLRAIWLAPYPLSSHPPGRQPPQAPPPSSLSSRHWMRARRPPQFLSSSQRWTRARLRRHHPSSSLPSSPIF